ncbi:hypothetical protein B0H10DRAFT_2441362 [Mycena sp. CBHHK59/15]|nr:hypothetical protein B0H10DRAFT_2441362 [Mycena sp. CBHHK59/15]
MCSEADNELIEGLPTRVVIAFRNSIYQSTRVKLESDASMLLFAAERQAPSSVNTKIKTRTLKEGNKEKSRIVGAKANSDDFLPRSDAGSEATYVGTDLDDNELSALQILAPPSSGGGVIPRGGWRVDGVYGFWCGRLTLSPCRRARRTRAAHILIPRRAGRAVWRAPHGARGQGRGMWFRPSSAIAIRMLVDAFPARGLGVSVAIDGTLHQTELALELLGHSQTFSRRSGKTRDGKEKDGKGRGDRPVLLRLGIWLGPDGANPVNQETIKLLYTSPQLVGIAGKRPY